MIFNTAVIAIAIVALFTSPSDLNIDESTAENKNTINKILFNNSNNKIRNIKNIYYGYAYLDKDISFQNYVNNKINNLINKIAWFIPIKKWRDKFRKNL